MKSEFISEEQARAALERALREGRITPEEVRKMKGGQQPPTRSRPGRFGMFRRVLRRPPFIHW